MKKPRQNETFITPRRGWFQIDWRELWHYRDILYLFTRRDIVTRYKRSILGPLWYIMQPFLTAILFTFIFKRGLRLSTDGIPGPLFYFCGLLLWSYFSQSLTAMSASMTGNSALLTKVYFPRLLLPVSAALSNLASFISQCSVFLLLYVFFKFFTPLSESIHLHPHIYWMLPALFLQTVFTTLGFGFWFTALTAKYHDFQPLTSFLLQLWMFATPIIYPSSAFSAGGHLLLVINPLATIAEAYRYAFFSVGHISISQIVISIGLTGGVFLGGILVFNQVDHTLTDNL